MSVSKLIDIFCDAEGCGAWNGQSAGYTLTTTRAIRRDLQRHGWVHRDGKDYCPEHARSA